MTETPMTDEQFFSSRDTHAINWSHMTKKRLVGRVDAAEAERDAALATLAAARTMLDATGAALADATKRIEALEAERDAANARAYDTQRRATAAIAAWMRGRSDNGWSMGARPSVPTVQP